MVVPSAFFEDEMVLSQDDTPASNLGKWVRLAIWGLSIFSLDASRHPCFEGASPSCIMPCCEAGDSGLQYCYQSFAILPLPGRTQATDKVLLAQKRASQYVDR